jgi:hypothetical protein
VKRSYVLHSSILFLDRILMAQLNAMELETSAPSAWNLFLPLKVGSNKNKQRKTLTRQFSYLRNYVPKNLGTTPTLFVF